MRFLDCDGNYLGVLEEAKELPKSIIRSVIIETPEEEQQLRLFLMGALKVDERGCHALGHDFGSNALSQNPDVSNGNVALGMKPNGSNALADSNTSEAILKLDYSIEEKLRIIETLSSTIQRNEPMIYPHTKEAEGKLLALIQSI